MQPSERKGIIAWFAYNPVAANLLMLVIIIVGLGSALNIQRAMFPMLDIKMIVIDLAYPGAAPEEVEQGLVLKIEEAINDLDGIKRVESDSFESAAMMMIEPHDGIELRKLMTDIQNRVDAIQHFPEEAEKPVISQPELLFPALTLQLSGDIGERSMKSLADDLRREILTYPSVSAASVVGAREYEISVEISEPLLREYHLSLGDVANIISASSLDLPAGSVRTENGEIMLRTMGQAYVQQDFEAILLKTWPDGTRLMLGDIATVKDGFVDAQGFAAFNGQYSLGINVFAMGKQDIIETADAAKAFVANKTHQLPDDVSLTIWGDSTYYLKGRLSMMLKNLALGALLVFIILALFLEIKLAFWVMMGIPVCFLGAMTLINTAYIDASLNMISIFGFILVLGIVVDDAIIMGESAYAEQEKHGHSIKSVVDGVYRVATPATFGVLTTIMAFLPSLFIQGVFGAFPEACGWVVILCLCFSLVESKWILPAHLAHSKPARNRILLKIDGVQEKVNKRLRFFIDFRYKPFMLKCVKNRYMTLAFFLSLLILSAGLLAGGAVRTVLAPDTPGEFLTVELRMSQGVPEERTQQVVSEIAQAFSTMEENYLLEIGEEEQLLEHMATYVFDRINGRIDVELTREDKRSISTREVEQRWRDTVGQIHGAEVFAVTSVEGPSFGPSIAFDLMHRDFATLGKAAADFEEALRHYEGLYDIRNGVSDTTDEFHLDVLPEAESLGITRFDLGSQVRHAFYGAEAQRVQRGMDEIKVMVRYPKADRENVNALKNMYIRTPSGDEVPFQTVAQLDVKQGLIKATRINYQRAAELTAEANKRTVEPDRIMKDIETNLIPELQKKYPGLTYGISGAADEEAKLAVSMIVGFGLALFGVYALLAIPTKSYLQPLIIMGVIPFGMIGAIFGHWVMGHPLSMMSLMGVIALSGVVVNDSLIMVDFVNKAIAEGKERFDAVVDAGTRRFRAILLTSLTTFFGLAPMLLEKTAQAESMVPMAISLAYGIVFATVITLLLIPCLYMILQDLGIWWAARGKSNTVTGKPELGSP
ncbi:efflux RND transporter permease subunit [Candidatus Marimicrobium litorale]|uniref:Efflux RND transporter permease subunit n=1 Tax=Candidatus Marimicrobium litorale TaxID=2518991 RepID=A0ABT3T0J6_9GAMM|nr:efflux RND transporter permease subunit [Candidatus Marimicrobium litorale]MCX2975772.1 efflux RND transporter permease subunit [Candidatus Marimicrobium litorale]